MLSTRDIPGVEILSVGTWHGTGCPTGGCVFSEDDLDQIVADAQGPAFTAPIKLGHDNNQKLLQEDGYPAAGWLANVRRQGEKLIADLMKVPAKIADLIDAGAYRNRSVEFDRDNKLVGMALLGADLPAVENLADIMAWYTRQNLSLESDAHAIVFSAPDEPQQRAQTYTDNAEHVLADVQAFVTRSGELASLRAKDGRSLSKENVERLTSLHAGVIKMADDLALMLAKPPDEQPPDYSSVMQARVRLAALRMADLVGAST